MTETDYAAIAARLDESPVVRVTVIRAEGSSPREVGAAMLVTSDPPVATIGGGALEFAAIAHARTLLKRGQTHLSDPNTGTVQTGRAPWCRDVRAYPLGPALGQCCGGYVELLFEVFTAAERPVVAALASAATDQPAQLVVPLSSGTPPTLCTDRTTTAPATDREFFVAPARNARAPLYLYGAGHVGREVARIVTGLPIELAWIDFAANRFPAAIPPAAGVRLTSEPAALAASAPADALHLVMTCSHVTDEAICRAVLEREFRFLGLIGSKTKRARFVHRLGQHGIATSTLARLVCPVGIAGIHSKEPAMIAVAIAAQIAQELTREPESTWPVGGLELKPWPGEPRRRRA